VPGGRVHNAITLATASGVLAPYLIVQFGGNPYYYVAGCLTGILISPDLDIDKGNVSDTLIRKIFPPAQWIWRILWTPYAKLISHRSPISHFPFLGTLFRIGYIFLLLNLFKFLFFLFGNIFSTVSLIWFWNWWLVLGLCHVDICHYLADITIKSKEQFENE